MTGSITHEACKSSLSQNSCIKLQSLALAGRHQCYINLQSPNCDSRVFKTKAHKYKSPNCKFCNRKIPEDTLHIIGKCKRWDNLRKDRDIELRDTAQLRGIYFPPDMLLNSNHDYSLIRNKQQDKHNWIHSDKLWASTGKLPHHSIAAINLHISDKKYVRKSLVLISATVLKHQLLLIHTQNKEFNLLKW